MKCDAISATPFIALRPIFASVPPYLGMISSAFSLSHFLKRQGLWRSKNRISMKTYETVSTSNFLIPLLSAHWIHSLLYVQIWFRTFWKTIIIWLTYLLTYASVKWNQFVGHTTSSLYESKWANLTWMKVNILFGATVRKNVGRIHSSITKDRNLIG